MLRLLTIAGKTKHLKLIRLIPTEQNVPQLWNTLQNLKKKMTTPFYLIIYDLPDNKKANKRRTRLHKLLSGYGEWTQYSVFECFLTKIQFAKLKVQIEQLIKPQEDSVRIYILDARSIRKTITYGSEQPRENKTIIL